MIKTKFQEMQISNMPKIHPGFSVDCVIFSFYEDKLRVLLNKHKLNDKWMLPRGFLGDRESVDESAQRVLFNQIGVCKAHLQQFYLFGSKDRTVIDENKTLLESHGLSSIEIEQGWRRHVSIGYLSFIRYDKVIIPKDTTQISHWFALDELPQMYSDNKTIIEKAIETTRTHGEYLPTASELLPDKFTISELRRVYQEISGKTLDRRNFRKKMLLPGIITELDDTKKIKTHPRSGLFIFNKKKIETYKPI